ncbi:MAG: hypothetical protein FD135_3721 [Comamonadaceae bacterium]|nr:MAG: hypothetical protein FD135_3721 [Comamonadaceae bacterium]
MANELAARRWAAIGQGLGVVAQPTPQSQGDFGQLGGFAGAGFTTHDDDLVRLHGGHDLLTAGGDGQVFGEFDVQGRCTLVWRAQHQLTKSKHLRPLMR